ncbi:MAG: 5-deoxy-glucuronate isomerase [Anaerolineae bacterium]
MNLLIKNNGFQEGYVEIASPRNSPLQELEFGRLQLLAQGKPYTDHTGGYEVVLNILTGRADVEVEGQGESCAYRNIGWRDDVFSAPPTMVYLPPGTTYRVVARSYQLDVAVAKAPVTGGGQPRETHSSQGQPALIRPSDVEVISVGAANWRRRVNLGSVEEGPTQRLMVGETINPPGNWSSYPPHKHDTDNPPAEGRFEEVYFYLTRPEVGFGIQRVYTRSDGDDALDEVYVVENGDTVVLPCGYHPVVAAPGYQLYYFWAMLGREKRYRAWSDDPVHAWMRHAEPMLLEGPQ